MQGLEHFRQKCRWLCVLAKAGARWGNSMRLFNTLHRQPLVSTHRQCGLGVSATARACAGAHAAPAVPAPAAGRHRRQDHRQPPGRRAVRAGRPGHGGRRGAPDDRRRAPQVGSQGFAANFHPGVAPTLRVRAMHAAVCPDPAQAAVRCGRVGPIKQGLHHQTGLRRRLWGGATSGWRSRAARSFTGLGTCPFWHRACLVAVITM